MKRKIFLLNGPARSGKDTGAAYLADEFGGKVMKFAAPLKRAAAALFCDGDQMMFDYFDLPERKDLQDPQFLGHSPRQVQIDLSEKFMKPIHGETVFGEILANEIENSGYETILVSDSGFVPEAEVIVNRFGAENITLIRIHRYGFDYSGDSRSYVNLDHLGVTSYDVENVTGDVDAFFAKLSEIVAYNIGHTK